MNNIDLYKQLKDVKIIDHRPVSSTLSFFSLFGMEDSNSNSYDPQIWTIIYHKNFKKYLVTDDIHKTGLSDEPKNLTLIGQSDNIDATMFMIYEHQISRRCKNTIFKELKEIKVEAERVYANKDEWYWSKKVSKTYINNPFWNSGKSIQWSILGAEDFKYKLGMEPKEEDDNEDS